MSLEEKSDTADLLKARGAYKIQEKCLEEGELNSAFFPQIAFFKLEMRNFTLSTIDQLCGDGKIVKNPKEIAKYSGNFCKNFYSSRYSEQTLSSFLDLVNYVKVISVSDIFFCDGIVTPEEVAIKSLKNNKSPWFDGLAAELYKLFADELSQVFRESIEKEASPPTLMQSIITLIPKPKKDLTNLDNWWPITLLNNDYKISTIIFAKRLIDVIDETQSGFMRDRHIMNNIRFVLDLLDYSDLLEHNCFVLFLDFYKAFDSVEHKFRFKSVEKLGFGEYFCKAVRTLHYNCIAQFNSNMYFS